MTDTADRDRDELLVEIEQAAEQIDAWTAQRETLVRQAFARGVSQRAIAPHAQVDQSTISRMIARHRTPQSPRP